VPNRFADLQHTILAVVAIAAITVLSATGKCSQVEAVTVILAASGIGATGIVASRGGPTRSGNGTDAVSEAGDEGTGDPGAPGVDE